MAVYDYTTKSKVLTRVGKIYDYNGTTTTGVARAYDHNGKILSLVYEDEIQSTVGGTYALGTFGLAQTLVEKGQKYVRCSNGNGTGGWVYQSTDLTNFDKIVIVCTLYKSAYTFLKVGVSTNFAVGAYPWPSMLVHSYDNMNEMATQAEQKYTLTYDISSLSGVYQVGGWIYSGSVTPNRVRCDIHSITLIKSGS